MRLLFYSVNKYLLNTFYVPRTRQDMGGKGTNGNNRLLSEASCPSKGWVRNRKSVRDPVRDAGLEHRRSPRKGGQVPVGWNQTDTRLCQSQVHMAMCTMAKKLSLRKCSPTLVPTTEMNAWITLDSFFHCSVLLKRHHFNFIYIR